MAYSLAGEDLVDAVVRIVRNHETTPRTAPTSAPASATPPASTTGREPEPEPADQISARRVGTYGTQALPTQTTFTYLHLPAADLRQPNPANAGMQPGHHPDRQLLYDGSIPLAQHLGIQLGTSPAQCSLNQYPDPIVFPAMIRYTALNGHISEAQWAQRFGTVSNRCPFGEHIWQGMLHELAALYLPSVRGYAGWTRWDQYRPAWFTIPRTFSRANAALRKCDIYNPAGNQTYPCMVLWSEAVPPAPEGITMICINILIRRSQPWRVHISWLEF